MCLSILLLIQNSLYSSKLGLTPCPFFCVLKPLKCGTRCTPLSIDRMSITPKLSAFLTLNISVLLSHPLLTSLNHSTYASSTGFSSFKDSLYVVEKRRRMRPILRLLMQCPALFESLHRIKTVSYLGAVRFRSLPYWCWSVDLIVSVMSVIGSSTAGYCNVAHE